MGNLLDKIFKRSKPESKTRADSPRTPREGGGEFVWLGTQQGAMAIATVFRCVKLLSDSVGKLPFEYRKLNNGVFKAATAGRINYLLGVQPSPWQNSFDFKSQIVSDVLMWGNAYIVPIVSADDMDYSRFQLVRPWCVSYDTATNTYRVDDFENAVSGVFSEDEVIHVKGFGGSDAKQGLSVLSFARQTTTIAVVGDTATMERMSSGGDVRGIIGNDRSVKGIGKNQDQQLQFAAIDIDEKFRTGQKIVHVPGSLEFKQLSMSSADMQFLESRKFTVREICRFFGVHPSFVFDDTSNNYKSAEMANVAFLSDTLDPLLKKIEAEFTRKLVIEEHAPYRRFEFERSALYACDLASQMNYYTKMLQAGLATPNELRAKVGMEPIEGGDKLLVSANLKSIDEIVNEPNQGQDEQVHP